MRHRWYGMTVAAAGLSALLTGSPQTASAVNVDPGEYEAAPPGTSFLIGYGIGQWYRGFHTRSGNRVGNSKLDAQTGILRPVHFVDLWGVTADPQFFVIYGWQNNARLGGDDLQDTHGLYDPILASTFWIINDQEKKRWFGITPFLWLPLGNYSRNNDLNTGENRWKGAIQLGYIEHFADDWAIDFYLDSTIYGDNDNYGSGGKTMKQDPSYQFQSWLRYYITPEWNIAPGYSATWGGYQRISGEPDPQIQTQAQQLRLATQYFITPDLQFETQVRTDVWNEGGFREAFGLAFRVVKIF